MDISEVFEEEIVKKTEQKLKYTLEKLKSDKILKRKFRELADTSTMLNRFSRILKDRYQLENDTRGKWIQKRNELSKKYDEIYYEIKQEGLEKRWIEILVNFEIDELNAIMDKAREEAYKKYFGQVNISNIDIMDSRWESVGQDLDRVKTNYFEGEK